MRNIAWKLIEVMALQLTSTEREIVLGDLIETRETALRGMREISGLVMRRQLQLWNGWSPWLAAPGLALPCSFMLMGFSFAISSDLRNRFVHGWQLGFFSTEPGEFIWLLCQVLVLLICAWAAGFTVESVSRRTLWSVQSAAFYHVCFVCYGFARNRCHGSVSCSFCFPRSQGFALAGAAGQSTGAGLLLWLWQQQSAWLYWQLRTPVGAQLGVDCAHVVSGHSADPAGSNGGSPK